MAVLFTEFTVGLTKAERDKLAVQQTFGKDEEWIAAERQRLLEPRVAQAKADLEKGVPFDQVALKHGKLKQPPQPRPHALDDSLPGDDPRVKFLRTGKLKTSSPPIRTAGGEFRFYHLIDREEAGSKSIDDPKIYQSYREHIHTLRRQKVEALMRLQALDKSTVKPDRIRQELRESLVAGLRHAEMMLRGLGIH